MTRPPQYSSSGSASDRLKAFRSPPRRQRRTQEERSAETRALLIDVTLECLAELGYAGTTSQVIAERAGLSRGAQLHHFGTKAKLVAAAMEQLYVRRLEEFRRGLSRIKKDTDYATAAVDLLWKIMSGPTGYAYMELVSAARTDPELREEMIDLTRRMDEGVDQSFQELFQSPTDDEPLFEVAWTGIFAIIEGLAFEKIVRPRDKRLDQVLKLLKQYAPMLMARPK